MVSEDIKLYQETPLNIQYSCDLVITAPLPEDRYFKTYKTNKLDDEDRYAQEYIASDVLLKNLVSGNQVQIRVIQNYHVMEIALLQDNTRRIRLEIPSKIAPNCITFSGEHHELENSIVIDFVTEDSPKLCTVMIPLTAFTAQSTSLRVDYPDEWFVARQAADHGIFALSTNLQYAASYNVLVFAQLNGELIKIARRSPLDPNTVSYYMSSRKWSLFAKSEPKVPGHPGVSSRTVISMTSFSGKLYTLAANGEFTEWSLDTNAIIKQTQLSESGATLNITSNNSVKYFDTSLGNLVAVYAYTKLFLFRVKDEVAFELIETIFIAQPENFSISTVLDFAITQSGERWILWKSNTSSILQNFKSQVIYEVLPERQTTEDLDSNRSSDYYLDYLFSGKGYSTSTIESAVHIFSRHYSNEPVDESMPLKSQICVAVGSAITLTGAQTVTNGETPALDFDAYSKAISLQWLRFCRLCEELHKLGTESITMLLNPVTGLPILAKSKYTTRIRTLSSLELLHFNMTSTSTLDQRNFIEYELMKTSSKTMASAEVADSLLRLFALADTFLRSLPKAAYVDLCQALENDFLGGSDGFMIGSERMGEIFMAVGNNEDPTLKNNLSALSTDLYDLGDVRTLLEYVHELITSADFEGNELEDFLTIAKRSSVMFLWLLTAMANAEQKEFKIPGDVVLYSKYIEILKRLSILQEVLHGWRESNFTTTTDNFNMVREPEWLRGSGLNFSQKIFIERLTIIVLDYHQQGCIILDPIYLTSFLAGDSFSQFVKAHVYMKTGAVSEAQIIFNQLALALADNIDWDATQLSLVKQMSPHYSLLLEGGRDKFLLAVAKVARGSNADSMALALLNWAVESDDVNFFEEKFQCALDICCFNDAYNALVELQMINYPSIPLLVDALVTKMTQNGIVLQMCQYPFTSLSHLVEDVLRNRALEGSSIKVSGPFYRALYTWLFEHGDFRNAAIALYSQVQSLQTDGSASAPFQPEITALYALILNTIKCMDVEDQWMIIEVPNQVKRRLLKVEDLQDEYNGYLSSMVKLLK